MSYINHEGVQIHYEVQGQGEPLLLQHGLTANAQVWHQAGWVEALKNDYQLIIVDARGHGQSQKLTNSEQYAFEYMAADIVAILDQLAIEKTHFFGYSMGGYVGLSLAQHFGGRLKSLIVGGAAPSGFSGSSRKPLEELLERLKFGAAAGGDAFVKRLIELFGELSPVIEARYRAATTLDFQAYVAALTAFLDTPIDYGDTVKSISIPLLFYIGDIDHFYKEFIKRGPEMYPEAQFVILPGLDHPGAFYQIESGFSTVSQFLASAA